MTLPTPLAIIAGAGFILIGGLLIYLSNRNQQLLDSPLGRKTMLLGCGFLIAALWILLLAMGAIAAIASWFLGVMIIWQILPFLFLLKGGRK